MNAPTDKLLPFWYERARIARQYGTNLIISEHDVLALEDLCTIPARDEMNLLGRVIPAMPSRTLPFPYLHDGRWRFQGYNVYVTVP